MLCLHFPNLTPLQSGFGPIPGNKRALMKVPRELHVTMFMKIFQSFYGFSRTTQYLHSHETSLIFMLVIT